MRRVVLGRLTVYTQACRMRSCELHAASCHLLHVYSVADHSRTTTSSPTIMILGCPLLDLLFSYRIVTDDKHCFPMGNQNNYTVRYDLLRRFAISSVS